MTARPLNCVFLGLSITSTWGNGHATTYRGLLKEIANLGHSVAFLERDVAWYSENREFEEAPYCTIGLYGSIEELRSRYAGLIRNADIVVVGSYVPDGIEIGHWVTSVAKGATAFYDIDTPVTLASLREDRCEYISRDLYRKYDLYLSFTGGPTLDHIERELGSPCARPLYCSVDPSLYYPEAHSAKWELGYLGTYATDRQPALEKLLITVAARSADHRFVVAGPQYPDGIAWPPNVERIQHLPASDHRAFYNSQRFTLNVTRHDMICAGYSPSVRLFEAAACGVPILTDQWAGLETLFELYSEILPVSSGEDVASNLQMPADQRREIADKARRRTLRFHTAAVRAQQFESYVSAARERLSGSRKRSRSAAMQSETPALI